MDLEVRNSTDRALKRAILWNCRRVVSVHAKLFSRALVPLLNYLNLPIHSNMDLSDHKSRITKQTWYRGCIAEGIAPFKQCKQSGPFLHGLLQPAAAPLS